MWSWVGWLQAFSLSWFLSTTVQVFLSSFYLHGAMVYEISHWMGSVPISLDIGLVLLVFHPSFGLTQIQRSLVQSPAILDGYPSDKMCGYKSLRYVVSLLTNLFSPCRLKSDPSLKLGDVTSINLTKIQVHTLSVCIIP